MAHKLMGTMASALSTKAKMKYTCSSLSAMVGIAFSRSSCFAFPPSFQHQHQHQLPLVWSLSWDPAGLHHFLPVRQSAANPVISRSTAAPSPLLVLSGSGDLRVGKPWFISILFLSFPSLFHIAPYEY